ncbi:MAG: DUF3299 domain-containing protein [Gammaproteobacteria bacterium]|nr:DUF3299 domain-containing protein [Gammaproteobacteria bacterium]
MNHKPLKKLLLLVGLAMLALPAIAKEPELLMWDQMMPEEDLQPPPPIAPDMTYEDYLPNEAYGMRPVEELDGKFVKLPGFIVPLDSDEGGELQEFLLVPYFGACIHVPPPPPNQIVYVTLEEPVTIMAIWEPYWIIGTIETSPYLGDIATTVYQMVGEQVEVYKY